MIVDLVNVTDFNFAIKNSANLSQNYNSVEQDISKINNSLNSASYNISKIACEKIIGDVYDIKKDVSILFSRIVNLATSLDTSLSLLLKTEKQLTIKKDGIISTLDLTSPLFIINGSVLKPLNNEKLEEFWDKNKNEDGTYSFSYYHTYGISSLSFTAEELESFLKNNPGYLLQHESINGRVFNEFKQSNIGGGYYTTFSFSDGTFETSACSVTSLAILLSGYGEKFDPFSLALYTDYTRQPSYDKVRNVAKKLGYEVGEKINLTDYGVKKTYELAKAGIPLLLHATVTDKDNIKEIIYTTESHYMTIIDYRKVDDQEYVYLSNPNKEQVKLNGWITVEELDKNGCDYVATVIPKDDEVLHSVINKTEVVDLNNDKSIKPQGQAVVDTNGSSLRYRNSENGIEGTIDNNTTFNYYGKDADGDYVVDPVNNYTVSANYVKDINIEGEKTIFDSVKNSVNKMDSITKVIGSAKVVTKEAPLIIRDSSGNKMGYLQKDTKFNHYGTDTHGNYIIDPVNNYTVSADYVEEMERTRAGGISKIVDGLGSLFDSFGEKIKIKEGTIIYDQKVDSKGNIIVNLSDDSNNEQWAYLKPNNTL